MKVTAPEESVIRDIGHAFGYYDCGEERGLFDAFLSREAVRRSSAAMCAWRFKAACYIRRAKSR